MMHAMTRFLVVVVALMGLSGVAQAGYVLDQNNLSSVEFTGWAFGTDSSGHPDELAQTFTVGMSGTLARLDLQMVKVFYPGQLVVKLYSTIEGVPDPSRTLASFAIDPSKIPYQGQVLPIDLTASGIKVAKGDELAFALSMPGGDNVSQYMTLLNPYQGGELFHRSLENPEFSISVFSNPNFDWGYRNVHPGDGPITYELAFRTFVEPSAVPEPSSLAMIGVALAGLGAWSRRRRAGVSA